MSWKNTVKGVVERIFEPEDVTDKFTKQRLWLKIGDKYPQIVEFEAANAKIECLQGVKPGTLVEIDFTLRGRTGQGKYSDRVFNSVSLQDIRLLDGVRQSSPHPAPQASPGNEEDEDVPF
ncbi:DUF3127 domain-containing protein [Ruficoccus amylovorans]|uniref:DUF3127 domain-containing protein n=1 Tax=Ruficoccus amylovorans TaxID=1804625 RepID=A0A842HF48_9BACT|nr:DUF3127 domain-containing protein [Ruficoccus amylovorans]MBC2594889.1 DUF3127 domain-containing protein [Ruficoccus amylovorans]